MYGGTSSFASIPPNQFVRSSGYLPEHVSVHYVCNVPAEEGVGFPETRVTDSCEIPSGCWQFNPGPLKKAAY